MPIDLIVPEKTLRSGALPVLAAQVTETLLHWTDATNDDDLRANVGVYIHERPADAVFAGGRAARVARVDVKLPTVALSEQDRRTGFIADVTAHVRAAAADGQRFDHVWINIVHAVEGGWGVDGVTFGVAESAP